MIKLESSITQISVDLYGEAVIANDDADVLYGSFDCTLPSSINYNSSWSAKVSCTRCSAEVCFGVEFGDNKTSLAKWTFKTTDYLSSKKYDKSFLNEIDRLFENIFGVYKNDVFLLMIGCEELIDFATSKLAKVSYCSCQNCNAQFLALVEDNPPVFPEKGFENGMVGELRIYKILHVYMGDHTEFDTLCLRNVINH